MDETDSGNGASGSSVARQATLVHQGRVCLDGAFRLRGLDLAILELATAFAGAGQNGGRGAYICDALPFRLRNLRIRHYPHSGRHLLGQGPGVSMVLHDAVSYTHLTLPTSDLV